MVGVYYFFPAFPARKKRGKKVSRIFRRMKKAEQNTFWHELIYISLVKCVNSHASSISTAEEVMFDGDVRQQPTNPVMKATNMKKKLTMKNAIIARPKSGKKRIQIHFPKKTRNQVLTLSN